MIGNAIIGQIRRPIAPNIQRDRPLSFPPMRSPPTSCTQSPPHLPLKAIAPNILRYVWLCYAFGDRPFPFHLKAIATNAPKTHTAHIQERRSLPALKLPQNQCAGGFWDDGNPARYRLWVLLRPSSQWQRLLLYRHIESKFYCPLG